MTTALKKPTGRVVINGDDTDWTEWHTQHGVEAGIAQASVSIPRPLPSHVFEGAKIVIHAEGDAGDGEKTCFVGRIRGPVDMEVNDTDATVAVRADGLLWKLALPALADFIWVGPITPRKLLKQMFLFWGYPHTMTRVEQFVHPTTGVPILLGGIPWFDEGRIVVAKGESPLALADRICRLFGYRIYDRPDGTIRVSRVNGRPPDADWDLTQGENVLTCTRSRDLHPISTYWEAIGASGTDLAGQSVSVSSRPRRGIKSKFIPNPPKYAYNSVSDSLLVTYPMASAARVVAEKDNAGPQWTLESEAIGEPSRVATLAPRMAFSANIPLAGVSSRRFWLVGINQDFTTNGYWATIEGWRPTGRSGKGKPPDDVDNPSDPWEADTDPRDPPGDDEFDPFTEDDSEASLDDSMPPTWDLDNSDDYVAIDDPDYDPDDPTGFLDVPPLTDLPPACPIAPIAPERACQTIILSEDSWADESDADTFVYDWTPTRAADSATVCGEVFGEVLDLGLTIEIWQDGALLGSELVTDGDGEDWTPFCVTLTVDLEAGLLAEVHAVIGA